ncbi:MAG: ATP-dependent DNA helicase RecG [Actinomycetaceae bacterium]|nr:ATP-dependent DNA helicase RecG [Actinomycetaceae bacterium]
MITKSTHLNRLLAAGLVKKFAAMGITTCGQLLEHFPFRYQKKGELAPIGRLQEGLEATVYAKVLSAQMQSARSGRKSLLKVKITDGASIMGLTFFAAHPRALSGHERRLLPGVTGFFSGKVSVYAGSYQLNYPSYVLDNDEQFASFDHKRPIPVYHVAGKLKNEQVIESVKLILGSIDPAEYGEIIEGDGNFFDVIRALHQPQTDADWQNGSRKMAEFEALVTQTVLAQNRVERQHQRAPKMVDKAAEEKFIKSLPFALTDGQSQAISQISHDLGGTVPMSRLIQGDVGSGKTVVALAAMALSWGNDYQAALLAPTEILAEQHFASIAAYFAPLGVQPLLLTASQGAATKRQTLATLASGKAAIVVGTHALLSDTVQLPRLGVVVIDEQHRFGVEQRDLLRQKSELCPHLLVTTATPIPRTLAMSVFGDLEITTIRDMPKGRKPVVTHLVPTAKANWVARIWQRARTEIDDGGRVFVVCPVIDSEDDLASVAATTKMLQREEALVGINIAQLHGRMQSVEKDTVMRNFAAGQTPILVSTTVIEVGVDVPAATMMVILEADRFGLSQLHQLRGRIGRGDKPGVCLAVTSARPGTEAWDRLAAFAATTDGFVLAQKDLEIRDFGNVLGSSQSGVATDLKFLDVLADEELIRAARRRATEIVAADPQLREHPGLQNAIASYFTDDQTEFIDKT